MFNRYSSSCFMCTNLQGAVYKDPRTHMERFVFSAAYMCTGCDVRMRQLRPSLSSLHFIFSRHTTCPSCGIDWVRPAAQESFLSRVSRHPLSFIQQIRRAPSFICVLCGMHYYDSRSLKTPSVVPLTETRRKIELPVEKPDNKTDPNILQARSSDKKDEPSSRGRSQAVSQTQSGGARGAG
jgi:hypothetical protein